MGRSSHERVRGPHRGDRRRHAHSRPRDRGRGADARRRRARPGPHLRCVRHRPGPRGCRGRLVPPSTPGRLATRGALSLQRHFHRRAPRLRQAGGVARLAGRSTGPGRRTLRLDGRRTRAGPAVLVVPRRARPRARPLDSVGGGLGCAPRSAGLGAEPSPQPRVRRPRQPVRGERHLDRSALPLRHRLGRRGAAGLGRRLRPAVPKLGGSRAPPAEMDGVRRCGRRRRAPDLGGAVDGVATRPAARSRGVDPPPGGHVGGDLALPPLRRRPHRQPHGRIRRDHRPAGGNVRRGGRPRGRGPVLTDGGRCRCVRGRGRVPAGPRPGPGERRPPFPACSLRDPPRDGRLRRRPPSRRGVRRRPGGSVAGGGRRADVHRRLRHRDRGLARHPRPAGHRRRKAPGPLPRSRPAPI